MGIRDSVPRGTSIVCLAVAMLAIPAFDMTEDVVVGGKSPLSTVFENAVFVALALALAAGGLWLVRNDWPDRYVNRAVTWSVVGTVVVAVLFGWVLAIQLVVQNELKPYVIAADGVVIGSLAALLAGIYSARGKMEEEALAAERDRFSALFDSTSDCVAAFTFGEDGPVLTDANARYRDRFGEAGDVPRGSAAAGTLYLADGEGETSAAQNFRRVADGEEFQTEVRRATTDGRGDFLVSVVPTVGARDGWPPGTRGTSPSGFLVYTDITAQKDRERQLGRLSEASSDLVRAGSRTAAFRTACAVTADLFDDAEAVVWTADGDAGAVAERDPEAAVADGGGEGGFAPVVVRRTDGEETTPTPPPADVGREVLASGRSRVLDSGEGGSGSTATRAAPGDGTGGPLFLGTVSDAHLLTVQRPGERFSPGERFVLDVLVRSTQGAVDRVDRERELARRNDQLEFLNSLLRHDIQNSMTVVRARGEMLADDLTGREAEFAETVVEQSDEVASLVDRFRVMLDALTGDGDDDLGPRALVPAVEDRVRTLRTVHPEADVRFDPPDAGGDGGGAGGGEEVTVTAGEALPNVLGNVLSNAVEHNDRPEPTVDVSVEVSSGSAVVRVADDGPGVPDGKKDAVFRRGERGLKEEDVGSGFGLFFVETMVDRYGGSVRVRDNDPRGAVFELEFQLA